MKDNNPPPSTDNAIADISAVPLGTSRGRGIFSSKGAATPSCRGSPHGRSGVATAGWVLNAMRRPSATMRSIGEALPELTADDLISISAWHLEVTAASCSPRWPRSAPTYPPTNVLGDVAAPRGCCRRPCASAERRQLTVMFCDLVGSTDAVGTARPRGSARDHRRLSSGRRRCLAGASTALSRSTWATACWSISATRERMRTMPSGRSGRGWAVIDAVGSPRCQIRQATSARRDRHRAGGRRRFDRRRLGAGAIGRRRNAEPRRPAASPGRAGRGRHRRGHAPAGRRSLRVPRSRRRRGQGHRRAGAGLAGTACPSVVASRFEALRGSALSPLVGRDEEIDLLLRRWARAKAGDGQVVLISGEPGIGKSRHHRGIGGARSHSEPHLRLRYFCSHRRVDAPIPDVARIGPVLAKHI